MGNRDDFAEFFRREYDGMVRALTLVFGDRTAAEDAAQVGFERALRKWRRVATMERPGTWVYVVALRHGRRHLRDDESSVPDLAAGGDHAQATVDWISAAARVRALPPRQRAVVVLRYLADLPLAEIGDALGMKLGTVKSTLHAAHRQLQIEAATESGDGPAETQEVDHDAS